MNDLVLVGVDIKVIEIIKRKLMERFKMTNTGDVSRVLGVHVTGYHQNKTLTISQENYLKSIGETFIISNCKPTCTPGYGPELSTKQPEYTLLNEGDTQRYQAITRSVMNLAQTTRYDIMHSTCQLARAIPRPSKVHMGNVKHLLRFLAAVTESTLVYMKGGFKRSDFSDSNWGNNPDNGKSTSCYIVVFFMAPLSFRSGVQSITVKS